MIRHFLFLLCTVFFVRCADATQVMGFNIRDSNDSKKMFIDLIYDDRESDTILLDKSMMKDYNKIWKAIEQILNERHIE